ncbi:MULTISPECIES: hypothetical protein [Enterobacteriaceae]|uniref:hypothetical protein n=1 Tax=Enterobacterales TaxID=91347 RepID=UPI00351004F8
MIGSDAIMHTSLLPISRIALSKSSANDFIPSILRAVNNMMLFMLAAICCKDYEHSRKRQLEGIVGAREKGKYTGRQADKGMYA